ncbi:SLAM family member 5-like [Leptodactylus fuscus]
MSRLRALCAAVFTILYIQPTSCLQNCSTEVLIPTAEGDNVTLHVNETEVKEISWILRSHHIVTTKPGRQLEIKNFKLKKRLQGTDQGSLKIINVNIKDQGEYSATVFKEEEKQCVQNYKVTVFSKLLKKDITITVNVSGDNSCRLTCNVNKPDVTTFWSDQRSENNTVVRNHTLELHNTHLNSSYKCIAESPVTRISTSIKPWTVCHKGREGCDKKCPPREGRRPTAIIGSTSTLVRLLKHLLETLDVVKDDSENWSKNKVQSIYHYPPKFDIMESTHFWLPSNEYSESNKFCGSSSELKKTFVT